MSSGPKHKMYEHEVSPPGGIWEKIAAELDESQLDQQYPSKLRSLEIAPPATAWQHITEALDQAPAGFAAKLAALEVTPPVTAWSSIEQALNTQTETVRAATRTIPWIKYAAAAAVIAFLAWGGLQVFSGKTKGTDVAKKDIPVPAVNQPGQNSPALLDKNIAVGDVDMALEEARNDAALENSKKTFAKLDLKKVSKIKNAAAFYFSAPEEEVYHPNTRSIDPEPVDNNADRYIMLMTPEGNIIRMSKKLSDMVCCVSGEDQDKDCMDQMKRWREKLANPYNTHSPGNFMDILRLVNSLQDN